MRQDLWDGIAALSFGMLAVWLKHRLVVVSELAPNENPPKDTVATTLRPRGVFNSTLRRNRALPKRARRLADSNSRPNDRSAHGKRLWNHHRAWEKNDR